MLFDVTNSHLNAGNFTNTYYEDKTNVQCLDIKGLSSTTAISMIQELTTGYV